MMVVMPRIGFGLALKEHGILGEGSLGEMLANFKQILHEVRDVPPLEAADEDIL